MAPQSMLSPSIIALFLISIIALSSSMAEADSSALKSVSAPVEATVHIVYTDRPQDEELDIYHLRTFSSVLGRTTRRSSGGGVWDDEAP